MTRAATGQPRGRNTLRALAGLKDVRGTPVHGLQRSEWDAGLLGSLERGGPNSFSYLESGQAADPLTLPSLRINGAVLDPDHGYPCRLVGPNRPGVQQTKWVAKVTVL